MHLRLLENAQVIKFELAVLIGRAITLTVAPKNAERGEVERIHNHPLFYHLVFRREVRTVSLYTSGLICKWYQISLPRSPTNAHIHILKIKTAVTDPSSICNTVCAHSLSLCFLYLQGRPEFSEVVTKLEECLCNIEVKI